MMWIDGGVVSFASSSSSSFNSFCFWRSIYASFHLLSSFPFSSIFKLCSRATLRVGLQPAMQLSLRPFSCIYVYLKSNDCQFERRDEKPKKIGGGCWQVYRARRKLLCFPILGKEEWTRKVKLYFPPPHSDSVIFSANICDWSLDEIKLDTALAAPDSILTVELNGIPPTLMCVSDEPVVIRRQLYSDRIDYSEPNHT
jgi:hypothetical protein